VDSGGVPACWDAGRGPGNSNRGRAAHLETAAAATSRPTASQKWRQTRIYTAGCWPRNLVSLLSDVETAEVEEHVTDRGGQVTVTSQRHCVRLIIARYTNTYLLIYLLTPDETHFHSRDAMLARVLLLWPSACLSVSVCVCLSQIEVLSKLLNKSSWVLAGGASFHPSYTVLTGNSATYKK